MNCHEYQDWIPLYAGGDLAGGERLSLEAHLGSCAPCQAEVARFRECRAALAAQPESLPPGGSYAFLWEGIRREFFPVRTYRWMESWSYAALLLIGLSVGYLSFAPSHSGASRAAAPLEAGVTRAVPAQAAGGLSMEPVRSRTGMGMGLIPVDSAVRSQLGLPQEQGVEVRWVMGEGPASRAGLLPHDVVIVVGEESVGDLEAVRRCIEKVRESGRVKVVFLRRGVRQEAEIVLQQVEEGPGVKEE